MKKLMRINAFIAMVLSMLIVMTPFSYSILDWEEEEQEAQTGESIIVNVNSYEPTVLPSSVIEDGDVPVYVYLTGVTPGTILKSVAGSTSNAEPLYGNIDIKQVYIRPENEETLNYVRGNPKYVKPRKLSIDNLGYLIVTLKQIEKEADVPDEIKLNMRAEITFENAERLYSMIEQDLIIPEDPDEAAWREKPIDDYRFFAGRGAIRASSISEGGADLTVYGGMDLQWPFTGSPRPLEDLTLSTGETSDPIRMSAASDFMTNAFRVKLTDIVDPSQKRARIRVNINGEEKEYIVTEGSRLYPGSSLTVKEINVIKDSRTSKITYEIIVRGPRDTTRITKSFFEKIAEGAADLLGLVSDDAETAVRDAAGVDQTGSAAASRGRMAAGETAAEIAAENEKCQTCGGSSIDLNTCDKNECMGLGPCYYTESTVGIPGQVPVAGEYGVRTYNDQCYSCAKAESCSNFNDNREMCIAPACTNRAGLNCEWDESENICRAKAAAQEASETPAATSAPAESTETENSDAAKCANNLGLCETQCSSSQTPMPSFNEDCIAGKKCCAPFTTNIQTRCANNLGLCETQCSSSQTPMPSFNDECSEGNECCLPFTTSIQGKCASNLGFCETQCTSSQTPTPSFDVDCTANKKCCLPFTTSIQGKCASNLGFCESRCSSSQTPMHSFNNECTGGKRCCAPFTSSIHGKCASNLGFCETQCSSSQTPMPSFDVDCVMEKKCCAPFTTVTREETTSTTETAGAAAPRATAPTIASNAGEGVCKNKVIMLREGDTPEQWLDIITNQATQEMVYCTAIEEYKKVASLYFGIEDENGALYEDMANFRIGEIYYWLGDSETALIYYNKAIKNNKGEFILLARARIDELTEEALHHTRFKVGEFEENGVSIRVKVMEVLWQDESSKPSATIEVENEGTKKLKVGDSVFSQDATDSTNAELKYNWLVKDINFDSILVEQKYRTAAPEGYRVKTKVVQADAETKLDYGSTYRTARLKSVDMKKYAIVTIIPGTGAPLVSQTNFTVHMPIEKRAISLTPDEISSKINSTQEIIDDLDDIITTLNDVVVLWKKVCLVTFGYLTIKNSFFTGLARTQARRFAMHGTDGNSGWDAYCRQNSGESRLYEDYEDCIIENSASIEATTDASQDAIETVNNEMENYQNQPWYTQLTKNYTNLGEYQDYVGTDLFDVNELRDYRYWQLMKQAPVYNNLRGARQGEGYAYNLRSEVDTRLSSMTLGNEEQRNAYQAAVSDVEANYENFDTLSEQEKTSLFSDLYGSHIANPDTRSNDFTYIETIGVTPLATIRREGRELYSNTPNGRITLHEATITDYQKGLAYAMSTDSGRMPEGMTDELKQELIDESQRIEAQYKTNLNAPLRTNQGQVYVDDQGYFYAPMTTAYITGEPRIDYAPGASAEFYPNGKPYCIPTGQGNYVKILDFYQDGSPSVIQQWNVGTDGLLCTEDDLLVQHQSMLERPEMESTQRRLIEQASSVGTHTEGQVLSAAGRDFTVSTSSAQSDTSRSQATCYDVMDPDDCRLLFGVCDPVMCPPSRFNMGGSWQVDDVVQTGLIGSLVLGLHNFDLPYEPVPICLTGVLAGLQNIKSVLRGYVECLKTAQVQGISVGICDKIRSVFICELIWKEAIAILNIKGGIMNWISQTFLDQGSGGGEYLTFESSISNVEDSVSFFTEQYATTAFASYTGRSSEELGTTLCKQAIFGQTPAFGEFFDQLAQPESPPQYTALLTVTGYSETQQQSRYEVFYHIYAGEDNPATYSVTIKNAITGDTRYATERCEGRQGSIEKGGIASFNIDCIAPKGFDQVCITLNGNTECGFGKVSTDFALNYLSDLVVSDEAQRNINSEEECSPSSPRTSPSLGSIPLPGTTGILSSGVQRVCSVQNPGQGTNPIDWKEVGTCGKDSTGRSLGACWIDMRTVSIHDTDRMQSVTDALDEVGFRQRREEMGMDLLEYNESINELNMIDETAAGICEGTRVAECSEITNAMSSYRYLESVTVTPRIAAKAGYRYSCLMEKAAEQCALFDLRSAVSRLENDFEYDIEAIYYEFLDKFEADVAPFMRGEELPPAFVNEYQARITARFETAKTNLTNMREMTEEKFTEYVGGIQAIYDRAFKMEDPFVFEIETSAEEQGQTSQIEENKCMTCDDGVGTVCRKPVCHNIGKTSNNRQLYCYYVSGPGIAIGGNDYTAFNKCHTCSRLSSCSEMTDDKDMCESAECTGKANNGEGLNCKYVAGQCVEKPANEAQSRTTTGTTGTGSSSIATSTTGSSTNCRPTPPDFFKAPEKELTLDLTKIGDKCDHEVMSGSSLKTKFPVEMINAAIAAQRETGVPAGYLLAQARHETGRAIIAANGDVTKLTLSPWGRKCTTASPRIPDYWINTGTVSGIDCAAQAQCPDGQSLNAAEEATIKARCENAGCVWTKTTEWCEALRSTTPGQNPPRMCTSTCFASAQPIGQQTLSQAEFYRDTIGGRYCQSCGPIADYMGSVTGFAARMGCVLPGAVHDTNWDNCLYKIIWENCLEDESNTDMIAFLQDVSKTCVTGTDPSTYTRTDMYSEGYSGSASVSTTGRSFASTEGTTVTHTTTNVPATPGELAKWAWPAEGRIVSFWNPPDAASEHNALDISNAEGSPIYASYTGQVVSVNDAEDTPECKQWFSTCARDECSNADNPGKPAGCNRYGGKALRIKDSNGRIHDYTHLSKILVRVGERVEKCKKIAEMGSTGNAHGSPHLHYAVYSTTFPGPTVNPLIFLNSQAPAARPGTTSATTGKHCTAS